MAEKFGRMKNTANIGDIISVKGYLGDLFIVEAWTHELEYNEDLVIESIIYDVTDVKTGDFLIVFDEDVTVVERAESKSKNRTVGDFLSVNININDVMDGKTTSEPAVESPRTSSETIDKLLDEINDYHELIRLFGDENNAYKTRIEYAELKLKEITGGGNEDTTR